MTTQAPEARLPRASLSVPPLIVPGSPDWITQVRCAESGSGSERLTLYAVPGPVLLTVTVKDTVSVELTVFFLMIRPPPGSTLFPYTALFRSLPGLLFVEVAVAVLLRVAL